MAKVNTARKSDSWRPGMVANGSGMISKNQKRKEKRYSHGTNAFKSQDTPTKKAMLGPLSKFKENLNQSLSLPPVGKKENKPLSTSLPIKAEKKLTPLLKKNVKPTGILSNSNTPKSKGNKVTFNMEKNVNKFIDSEAEEGEEPITDKVVKPYEKGSQKKQQLKRKMSMMDVEESEDEDSDDESFDSASEFVDMEASEGEETDSVDDEESDDDFLNDMDEDAEDDESAEEMESAEDEGDEEESDDDEEEEDSEDESDDEMPETNSSKIVATPNRRESMVAVMKKEKAESTPLSKKVAVKPEPVTPQSKKVNVKIESEQKKSDKVVPEPKKPKVEAETPAKGKATVEKKSQPQEKVKKDEDTVIGGTTPFVGIIRKVFKKISIDHIKTALSTKVDAKKIVGLRLTRDRNVFVYLKDDDTLNLLLNNSFPVTENYKFVVYKARDSTSEKKPRFVAFLPKVPLTTTVEELKNAIVKFMGTDCVGTIQFKKIIKVLQARQVLVHFKDVESLKKIVQKGELQIGSAPVVFRTAFETTVDVPAYRVLITSIPEKTSEAALKKAIESQLGQNTVLNIQFSQKKSSFAFVALRDEEAQKKALDVGTKMSVNGTKLEVIEFKPRRPTKKRAPPSDEAKERRKNKAKKQKLDDGSASNTPNSGKKGKKNKKAAQQKNASPKANVPKPHQTPSKVDAAQPNSKEAQTSAGPEAAAKSKKNKQFPKQEKGANAKEPQSPVKGPTPKKGANQKPEPQTPAKGPTPGKGANQKPESQTPAKGPTPGKAAQPKQQPSSPANGPAQGKGSKQQQKKVKKGPTNAQPKSQSPVSVSVNGFSPSSPKKKNKNKQQQQSPKPVDAKKQALVAKIASKKNNKKNSMRQNAS